MMNKDKKGTASFFSQFKKLASTVDHLVEEYKQSVNDKDNHEFCAPRVCKNITDMLNDLKQLKVTAQQELDNVKKQNQTLDGILSAGNNFLSSLKLEETEQYLGQYGFKSYDEVYGSKHEPGEDNDSKDEHVEDDDKCVEERPQTPPNVMAPPKDLNRTPRLEDFGLSEMTLQIMNSVQKEKPPEQKPSVQRPDWCSVPPVFHHDGIICTPSLTKSLNPNANASFTGDLHAALASPELSEMPPIQEIQSNPGSVDHLKLNNYQRSEDVKMNLTGLIKAEEHYSESAPVQPIKRTINVGLFKSEKNGDPVLKDPLPAEPCSLSHGFNDMEPAEPDFTYSLEALSEMTGVFKINSVMKPPTSTVKPYTPLPSNDDKENATPPEPKLLTEQVSHFKTALPKTDKIPDFDVKKYQCDDMPPSPKLLGNYEFLK